jgi:MFS transporter, NNP family, nitrate/nitrite transporter
VVPTEKQGTALGIFGAGNVGAAVTKFLAPFVLVAYGWHAVALVWAAGIAIMGLLFWFFTDDDPILVARRARGEKPRSAWLELEPLKNVQVWRFRFITSLSSAPSSPCRCGCRNT